MGHELTHGFDDQGCKFDGRGVLREWWEPSASAKFQERAQCVETLYGGIEVLPGVKLNGKRIQGAAVVAEAHERAHRLDALGVSHVVKGLHNQLGIFLLYGLQHYRRPRAFGAAVLLDIS